ncbi:hypothetical protein GGD63_003123 [Bradyrhizobium sp. cir1]|uniref:hypothetical protein n=1 Tax=Bradyrhizobium sp. cir1 TaxID=1445730 RepID=UPI001605F8AB|nr:hypothetical protein [Bradyrhizobium sp. cir1]MBB4370328.1 hypothetical protein [Bradyrhizobium sp. cir1]
MQLHPNVKGQRFPRALQNRFIHEADAFAFSNPTEVYDIDSPFISQPRALADILFAVASARGDEALPPWAR